MITEGFTEEVAIELGLERWIEKIKDSVSCGYRKRECGVLTKQKDKSARDRRQWVYYNV